MQKPRSKTLDRELGLFSVMSISMGAMLGSGIFVLPGLAVSKAGPALALAYLISALIVLPAALAKCELATALPRSGGTYLYVDRSIGPLAGTVVGLGTWFSLTFKSAFALVGLGAYFKILVPALPSKVALGLGIGVGLVLLNLLGVKKSSRFQNVVVVLALIGLFLFAALGAGRIETARYDGFFELPLQSLLGTAGFVFVSFAGVTKIASIAEEVKDPGRNIPAGILLSLGIVTTIYVVISLVLVGAVPIATFSMSVTPLAAATGHLWGPTAAGGMALLAVLTLTSMANSGLLSSSRYPLAMARDELLPRGLSKLSARFRTPSNSILLTGSLLLGLVAFVPVEELAKLASAFKLILFAAVNLALIVIRESGARWYKPSFRIPLYPILPAFGVLGALVLLSTMGLVAWIGAAAIIGTGLLWYVAFVRGRVQRRGAGSRLYGERKRLSLRMPRPLRDAQLERTGVIVPVFDDDDEEVDELIPLAGMLAGRGSQIQILRIEEVPEQLGLGDLEEVDPTTQRIAEHVAMVERAAGVSCTFENVLTHNTKHVLYERAKAEGTQWIVKAWPRRSPWRLLPDPAAWFHHHPPCNLVLFRDREGGPGQGIERFRKIVVLAESGPHDALVVHVADRLAQTTGAEVTLAYLVPEDASDEQVAALEDYHRSIDTLFPTKVGDPKIVRSGDDLSATIQLCQDYDLLVVGAPPQSEARGLVRGTFEDLVTERVPCAVLRVMAVRGLPHATLSSATDERGEVASPAQSQAASGNLLADALDHVELVRDARIRNKTELFAQIAAGLEERAGTAFDPPLEPAFWTRERKQLTALGDGVAVPHLTHNGIDRLHAELWILETPIDYQAKDIGEVDLIFALVGPPSERQAHLQTLACIGRLAQAKEFDRLRRATSMDDVKAILLGMPKPS